LEIVIVSSEFPPGPGGIGQHIYSVVTSLCDEYSITIITNQDYSDTQERAKFEAQFIAHRIAVVRFVDRTKLFAPASRIFQALSVIRKSNAKSVIVSGQFPLWIAGFIKLSMPKMTIHAFVHGSEITRKNNWKDKLNKWALSKTDWIYPVSNYTRSLLPQNLPTSKIRVIPNGLDDKLFEEVFQPNKSKISLEGFPRILTVGNVSFRKGQHRVIKALSELSLEYPEIHYHIVGLPTKKDEMLNLATQCGVRDRVTFHGRVTRDDLYQYYRSVDVFMMLSENQSDGDVEGFGIAILEANAFGLPAIGAKGCGIADALSKESGFLVDGNDPSEILKALNLIFERYESFHQGARDWAKTHKWSDLVKKIKL
jgi:phosphatidylinositol alpha-1,6-mannosyltransferase